MSCVMPNETEEVKRALRMNKLDYQEMRQRLIETERKLQSLNKLEAEIHSSVTTVSNHTFPHPAMRDQAYHHIEDLEHEDLESIPSAISIAPDSYTGFALKHMPSSTPSRYENKSQNNKSMAYSGFESDSSTCSGVTHSKYDIKLLKQNQRLLNEVERLIGDVHAANQKNEDLVKDANRGKSAAVLEDKLTGLMAENRSQDKSLREAEHHLDEGQRRISELQKRLNQTEVELVDVRAEAHELRLVKKEVESQRDEALHNMNKAQDSLEDYQKKTKEKIRQMEEREDKLQEDLQSANQERYDLLEQLSSMETSLASQEAQINRLLNDVSSEDARCQDLESANEDLKTQLNLMTAQLSQMEKEMKDSREVKRERNYLASEVNSHRVMARDLRGLLKLLQKNMSFSIADDSGNFSVKSWPCEACLGDGGTEAGLLAAELNCNNNGLGACEPGSGEGSSNMVCEMRNLVTNMDGEIQRLRADLKQRDADDKTYSNLRDELKVLMDKVESGVRHNRELECKVKSLDGDKMNVMMRLDETIRVLGERDRTIQCLETRLSERSSQIVCLQEDVDERSIRISCLDQQIHELQRKLKEEHSSKMEEPEPLKNANARIKELESILLCKNKAINDFEEKLAQAMKDLRTLKNESSQTIDCLELQLTDSQQEIERLKEDGEMLRQKLATNQKNMEDLRKSNRMKDEKIGCLSNEVGDLNYAKEKVEKLLTSQLEECEKRLKACQDMCNDLECSLSMCRNEVCQHLNTMDQIRASFENELEQRDACIRKLKEDLRHTVEELKCKMEDNNSLEHSVAELRSSLQQMCCQLKEADNNIQCLKIKVQEMEKLMLKEKSTWMKESEELERRLAQACNNLGVANNEIDTLKQQLQEKKNQNDCLQNEKTRLCQELKQSRDKGCCLEEDLKKLEADNQELCRQLQQKMECIRDMESLIRVKEQELKCLTKFIQDLQAQDKGDLVQTLKNEIQQLKDQLNKCREEIHCKSTMLCECEEAFKRCQLMSKDKENEIQLLQCQIDSLNSKLKERVARVEELERGIEGLNKDMERRMMRVDEQLKKYETELVNKVQEIADLKEGMKSVELNLEEKNHELLQQEQKTCLLTGELKSLSLKLKDAENTRDYLSDQLGEKKGELADLAQQLRLNREQMQKQHEDLVQLRQSYSCAQRDADKLRRELDDALASLEHHDCEISRLNGEKKNLMEKVAQLTCQLEQETSMLQQQLKETKCRMEKEMECLRNYSCQLENTNAVLGQKLSLTQRQAMQMEKCFHQKVENLIRDVDDLNNKLTMRDDEVLSCKDCLALKDSEISRLKRKLCGCDKPCQASCGKKNDNCHNSNVYHQLDGEEEDEEEGGPHSYKVDKLVLESRSTINLNRDWNEEIVKDRAFHNDRLASVDDLDQSPPALRLSSQSDSSNSSSTRNSLGVTEVQERLRSNQLRQKEIERQLQSLEEVAQDCDGGRPKGEEDR